MSNGKPSQTVARTMAVLEYLAHSDSPQSLAQISGSLELNKASALRILNSLIATGYVYRDQATGNFQCSFRLCELSSHILDRLDLKYITRPPLEQLSRETGETIHLIIRDWSQGVYIDKIESTHAIRTRSRVGERIYLHCTAAGKVLLADLPWSRVEQIIAGVGLPRRTANTITDPEALKIELAEIARQGWAMDREENEEGIQCVAAPVRNYRRNVVAAISITYPSLPGYAERMDNLRDKVCEAAGRISHHFGYLPESTTQAW